VEPSTRSFLSYYYFHLDIRHFYLLVAIFKQIAKMFGFLSSKYDPDKPHGDSVGSSADLKMPPDSLREDYDTGKKS
jgi:hypothetical protein